MVKLYGSTQHSAVHLLLAKNFFTSRLPSQTNDVRMHSPSVRIVNMVLHDTRSFILVLGIFNLNCLTKHDLNKMS